MNYVDVRPLDTVPKSVSVVVPVYRSENTIDVLCDRICETLVAIPIRFEIVLVEDCGGDDAWKRCRARAEADPRIRAIRMRRNFGQHNALLCGIRAAKGEVVVTLDDDLQNPPEEIPRLLQRLGEGFDVVYGTPVRQETTAWRRFTSKLTKQALRRVGGFDAAPSVSSFRAFYTDLRGAFADHRSPHVNIDVLLSWSTQSFTPVEVQHDERREGRSGYSTFKLIRHALNMLTGFSSVPLRAASLLGFGAGSLGIAVLAFVLLRLVISGQEVPGFAFLASSLAIFSGAQLFTIGIIGEYLGRLYFGSMGCPDYFVGEEVDVREPKEPAVGIDAPMSRL